MSSVLQYLEKPYEILQELIDNSFEYIIIDRTFFLDIDNDKIMVQKVPEEIYNASYPCWLLSKKKFLNFMGNDYILISEFDDYVGCKDAKGFFFKHK